MVERVLKVPNDIDITSVFGNLDENVKIIEKVFSVKIVNRDSDIKIQGDENKVTVAEKVVREILSMCAKGEPFDAQTVRYMANMQNEGITLTGSDISSDCVAVTVTGKPIKAKTVGQKKYLAAINENTVTIAIGPAGTGKTYLAVASAVKAFKAHEKSKIILTRPAVEAGEKLGFLPGDLQNKVDPYLRPLYDALFDMLGADAFQRNLEKGAIEVAPLAYMRGRTLDDAYIILDEAQNTTPEQMKMFLTRLGFNSKIVITGDVTQIDLPTKSKSGLIDAVNVLEKVDDIAIIRLTDKDVIRHKLVQEIIKAYDKAKAPKRK